MLISASWHVLPWCLHGMLVTCFGRKNWRIEHSKVLYTPVSQPCSKRPVWVPFPLNANELLRVQPKDGICTAHFFPPAEEVRIAIIDGGGGGRFGKSTEPPGGQPVPAYDRRGDRPKNVHRTLLVHCPVRPMASPALVVTVGGSGGCCPIGGALW